MFQETRNTAEKKRYTFSTLMKLILQAREGYNKQKSKRYRGKQEQIYWTHYSLKPLQYNIFLPNAPGPLTILPSVLKAALTPTSTSLLK